MCTVQDSIRLQYRSASSHDPLRPGLVTHTFSIVLPDGTAVGTCEVRLGILPLELRYTGHVSYTIFPRHRGHGYAAEALRQLCAFAASEGMETLTVTCRPENIASRRTCEKAGGEYMGHLPIFSENSGFVLLYEFHAKAP